jgi:spermidine synthase
VLIDAFTPGNRIPACLTTEEFLGHVKSLLRVDGVVAHNTWGTKDPQYQRHLATCVYLVRLSVCGTSHLL